MLTTLLILTLDKGTLPRILFYVTIASAGLLRHHLRWLYVGALAASLTYSGCAAIRACLLVWYGHAYGELDLIPLLGILSVSGIILVPLLTWSSTIRTAGPGEKKEIAEEEKEIDSSARTILVLWGLLVVVGLLSAYVAFIDGIAYGELGLWGVNTFSSPDTLTCAPQSGYLNITVGQEPARGLDGFSEYNFFSGNKDFVDANNCQYPCSRPYGEPALFRTNSDLVPLSSFEELALAGMRLNLGARARTFVLGYAYRWSYTIAFVMLQGIWTVCFGARTPSQTRTTIYGYLSGGRTRRRRGNPRLFVRLVACATALLFYLWSVFVVLLTIPLLVVHISAVELFVGQLPQSEPATHVGAWSPYASTTLVILGASFARLWSSIEWDSLKSRAHPKRLSQIIRSSCGSRKPTKPTASHGSHRNALRKVDDAFLAAAHLVFGHGTRKRVRKGWDDYIMFFVQPESQCHDLWYPDCKDYPACHNDVDYHSLHRTNHPEVTSAEAHVAVDVAPQIPMLHSALDVSMESLIQHTFLQHHPTG